MAPKFLLAHKKERGQRRALLPLLCKVFQDFMVGVT